MKSIDRLEQARRRCGSCSSTCRCGTAMTTESRNAHPDSRHADARCRSRKSRSEQHSPRGPRRHAIGQRQESAAGTSSTTDSSELHSATIRPMNAHRVPAATRLRPRGCRCRGRRSSSDCSAHRRKFIDSRIDAGVQGRFCGPSWAIPGQPWTPATAQRVLAPSNKPFGAGSDRPSFS